MTEERQDIGHRNPGREIPIISIVILVLLLGAWTLRWDTVVSKTYSDRVVKWQKDNWTGQIWYQQYNAWNNTPYFNEKPVTGTRGERRHATDIWWVLFIGNIGYAVYVVKKG